MYGSVIKFTVKALIPVPYRTWLIAFHRNAYEHSYRIILNIRTVYIQHVIAALMSIRNGQDRPSHQLTYVGATEKHVRRDVTNRRDGPPARPPVTARTYELVLTEQTRTYRNHFRKESPMVRNSTVPALALTKSSKFQKGSNINGEPPFITNPTMVFFFRKRKERCRAQGNATHMYAYWLHAGVVRGKIWI